MADSYDTLLSKYGKTTGGRAALKKQLVQMIKDPSATSMEDVYYIRDRNASMHDNNTSPNHRSKYYSDEIYKAANERQMMPIKNKKKPTEHGIFNKEKQEI